MKYLCFSDSHGTGRLMREALNMHRDTEAVFFLGDGLSDLYEIIPDFPRVAFYFVRGNCDYAPYLSHIEKNLYLTIENKKILLTHGDLFGVKGSLGALITDAMHTGCAIALFGHTHLPYESYDSRVGIHLFNPGSISEHYDGGSYGIITIKGDDILLSHGHIKH